MRSRSRDCVEAYVTERLFEAPPEGFLDTETRSHQCRSQPWHHEEMRRYKETCVMRYVI